MGRFASDWRHFETALPIAIGEKIITDETEAWSLLRNPLPPKQEGPLFDIIRADLGIKDMASYSDRPVTDLSSFTRAELGDALAESKDGLSFFERNNPIVRHTILRKRATLEELNLIDRIAVDIWPREGDHIPMFEGIGLLTSAEFDGAYQAAKEFSAALRRRVKSAGFMETLMLQRICSSFASGLSTAKRLMEKRQVPDDENDDFLIEDVAGIIDQECIYLQRIVTLLGRQPTDPKLDAVLHFLNERGWLDIGCIVFSQYYDTARWIAQGLTARLRTERVALYGGMGRSGIYFDGEWRSTEREDIKRAVRDRTVRLVVATDAACEGLNLQTLGTLINVDLPWNPSRLEQRIGRIKRFGQARERVDMLNLVYHDTHDEKVYQALSKRMKDRYDLFGSLPDTIEDEWIEDIENLDKYLSQFTEKKAAANAFELRYGSTVEPKGPGWELSERVLARSDVLERLSEGW